MRRFIRIFAAFLKLIFFGAIFGSVAALFVWFIIKSATDGKVMVEARTYGIVTQAELLNGKLSFAASNGTRGNYVNIRWKAADGTDVYAAVKLSPAYIEQITTIPQTAFPIQLERTFRTNTAKIKYLAKNDVGWPHRYFVDSDYVVIFVDDKSSLGGGCRNALSGTCGQD